MTIFFNWMNCPFDIYSKYSLIENLVIQFNFYVISNMQTMSHHKRIFWRKWLVFKHFYYFKKLFVLNLKQMLNSFNAFIYVHDSKLKTIYLLFQAIIRSTDSCLILFLFLSLFKKFCIYSLHLKWYEKFLDEFSFYQIIRMMFISSVM